MVEIMKTKRSFNARAKQLTDEGFVKCGDYKGIARFRKHIYAKPEIIIKLVRGWKKDYLELASTSN